MIGGDEWQFTKEKIHQFIDTAASAAATDSTTWILPQNSSTTSFEMSSTAATPQQLLPLKLAPNATNGLQNWNLPRSNGRIRTDPVVCVPSTPKSARTKPGIAKDAVRIYHGSNSIFINGAGVGTPCAIRVAKSTRKKHCRILHIELEDGTCVCTKHRLEHCDTCMISFTLPNKFVRKRNQLGRDLTTDETNAIIQEDMKDVYISRKICILDGMAVCPRSATKMRCPCNEVTYCSKVCQEHHWKIHKMTSTWHAEKQRKKAAKKKVKEEAKRNKEEEKLADRAAGLTEAQKNYVPGGEHSIEECAWQLRDENLKLFLRIIWTVAYILENTPSHENLELFLRIQSRLGLIFWRIPLHMKT